VARDYTVAPVIDLTVEFANLELTFSGLEYALSSSLDQAVNAGAAHASLTGTSSLALVEATAGKIGIDLPRPHCLENWFKDGGEARIGIGPYYLHLNQDYGATLVSGSQTATLHSHESFEGFGLVASLDLNPGRHDIGHTAWYWDFYSDITGAILVGQNQRISDFSVTRGLNPSVHDTATDFIPVGVLELGFEVAKRQAFRLGGT
jgi:hypothetical protein